MIRSALAWFFGESDCPVATCDGALQSMEAGYHRCTACAAVVDYERGGWSFSGSPTFHRLPGLSGMPYDRLNPRTPTPSENEPTETPEAS